jgi:hypothetical protein
MNSLMAAFTMASHQIQTWVRAIEGLKAALAHVSKTNVRQVLHGL